MKLNYKDYKGIKYGSMCSVGMIDNTLVFEMLTGFGCIPEYHKISKEEFDSFENWSRDKLFEILNRCVVASGYRQDNGKN